MNIYGYCRISTAKQSIDRQIRNIKAEYPTAHIVQEAYTGTSIFRPEWLKLYRVLKAGDTVVFDSVSRMSRNAEEGFALYEDLYHKGIQLVFLKEHHIDTETYKKALSGSIAMTGTNVDFILKGINEYLMALAKEQIKLAFEQSEKEVADLHQRTREGLLTARLNGKQVGRKKGVGFETKKAREAKQIIRTHCKTFGGTLDDVACINCFLADVLRVILLRAFNQFILTIFILPYALEQFILIFWNHIVTSILSKVDALILL